MNEMRKLMEVIEQINEDPTAGGRMRALYGDLSKVIRNATVIQTDFEKYPDLGEYKKIAVEVEMTCLRLRQLIGDVLK